MKLSSNNYDIGLNGEQEAMLFMENKGYMCLGRRVKTPFGEIDAVMAKDDAIIFVEVKKRKTMGEATLALSRRQINRLFAAASFIKDSVFPKAIDARVDLICTARDSEIQHIKNISFDV